MEDVFYGISGWHILNPFQCVVGLKVVNGFNFSVHEQSASVSQFVGKFAANITAYIAHHKPGLSINSKERL